MGEEYLDYLIPRSVTQYLQNKKFDAPLTQEELDRHRRLRENPNINSTKFNQLYSAIPGVISFAGQAYNAAQYGQTSDDILADTGKSYNYINGVGYQTYNNVNDRKYMQEEHTKNINNTLGLMATGASTGALLGPIGAGVGALAGLGAGLIGGGLSHAQARRELADANYKKMMTNNFNRSIAATQAAQMEHRNMYGNYENAPLHAALGSEPAYTSAGEVKWNPNDSYSSGMISGSKAEGDWIPTEVDDDTTIFTNKFNFAQRALPEVMRIKAIDAAVDSVKGKSAKEVTKKVLAKERNAAEQNLEALTQEQHEVMEPLRQGYGQHAADGLEWGNLFTSLTGGLIGLGQYFGAKGQRVKSPRTYVPNTQALRAMDTLDGLRISQKPIIDQINRDDAAARYRLSTAGGLSGAQKYLGNIALADKTQVAKANALANIQAQNNAYRSAAAQTRMQWGAQEAANMMQAGQWDLDYYSKAHAARQQGMQMGLYNSLNQLQQYIANVNKLRMFGDMRKLYEADINSRA